LVKLNEALEVLLYTRLALLDRGKCGQRRCEWQTSQSSHAGERRRARGYPHAQEKRGQSRTAARNRAIQGVLSSELSPSLSTHQHPARIEK
ncbi:MAG TPA: hypothetical protein VFX31_11070, partial [Ktedonobacterales bacterium]|nr:hypothetical protein [Ktedonobacterales bacterium]